MWKTVQIVAAFFVSLVILLSCVDKKEEQKVSKSDKDEEVIKYAENIDDFRIEGKNVQIMDPAILFGYSNYLYNKGEKDESVFFYYLAQYRARYLISILKEDIPLDERFYKTSYKESGLVGDPVLIGTINRQDLYGVIMDGLGTVINQYAFGDVDKLIRTLDEVLIHIEKYPFEPDQLIDKKYLADRDQTVINNESVKSGFQAFMQEISDNKEYIKEERAKNGL